MPPALDAATALMARAGMYKLLSLGFGYPTDDSQAEIDGLAAEVGELLAPLSAAWPDRLHALASEFRAAGRTAVEAEFNRLFSGGVECSPHETAYDIDLFGKQRTLADVAGFYSAFSAELPEGSRWPLDHVGVELEFCAVALHRMAVAHDQSWEEQAAVCDNALRSFLTDHLGRWIDAFTTALATTTPLEAYRLLAACARDWVNTELGALGLEPDRVTGRANPLAIISEDEAPPNCAGLPTDDESAI